MVGKGEPTWQRLVLGHLGGAELLDRALTAGLLSAPEAAGLCALVADDSVAAFALLCERGHLDDQLATRPAVALSILDGTIEMEDGRVILARLCDRGEAAVSPRKELLELGAAFADAAGFGRNAAVLLAVIKGLIDPHAARHIQSYLVANDASAAGALEAGRRAGVFLEAEWVGRVHAACGVEGLALATQREGATLLLDRYEIGAEIGTGAHASVFEANDRRLNRVVAVKRLRRELFLPGAALRFVNEASVTSSLRHPNILTVHDFVEIGGDYYIVSERMQGSLAQWIEARKRARKHPARPLFPPSLAASLVCDIARGLAQAHENDPPIIHRDLKPANILLAWRDVAAQEMDEPGPYPRVVVADFGIAGRARRRDRGGGAAAQTLQGMGTPAYMPPEQAMALAATPASDVFGIGTILYELLTGCPPYGDGDEGEALAAARRRDMTPLAKLVRGVPADLGAILQKCLELEANARYGSATELQADLERFQLGEAVEARKEPGYRAIRLVKRYWARLSLVLLLGVAIVATATSLVIAAFRDMGERKLATELSVRVARSIQLGTLDHAAIDIGHLESLGENGAAECRESLLEFAEALVKHSRPHEAGQLYAYILRREPAGTISGRGHAHALQHTSPPLATLEAWRQARRAAPEDAEAAFAVSYLEALVSARAAQVPELVNDARTRLAELLRVPVLRAQLWSELRQAEACHELLTAGGRRVYACIGRLSEVDRVCARLAELGRDGCRWLGAPVPIHDYERGVISAALDVDDDGRPEIVLAPTSELEEARPLGVLSLHGGVGLPKLVFSTRDDLVWESQISAIAPWSAGDRGREVLVTSVGPFDPQFGYGAFVWDPAIPIVRPPTVQMGRGEDMLPPEALMPGSGPLLFFSCLHRSGTVLDDCRPCAAELSLNNDGVVGLGRRAEFPALPADSELCVGRLAAALWRPDVPASLVFARVLVDSYPTTERGTVVFGSHAQAEFRSFLPESLRLVGSFDSDGDGWREILLEDLESSVEPKAREPSYWLLGESRAHPGALAARVPSATDTALLDLNLGGSVLAAQLQAFAGFEEHAAARLEGELLAADDPAVASAIIRAIGSWLEGRAAPRSGLATYERLRAVASRMLSTAELDKLDRRWRSPTLAGNGPTMSAEGVGDLLNPKLFRGRAGSERWETDQGVRVLEVRAALSPGDAGVLSVPVITDGGHFVIEAEWDRLDLVPGEAIKFGLEDGSAERADWRISATITNVTHGSEDGVICNLQGSAALSDLASRPSGALLRIETPTRLRIGHDGDGVFTTIVETKGSEECRSFRRFQSASAIPRRLRLTLEAASGRDAGAPLARLLRLRIWGDLQVEP